MKNKLSLFLALFCFLFLLVALLLIFFLQNTPPGTYLLDQNFSLLSFSQAQQLLSSKFSLPSQISLLAPQQTFSLSTASISAQINPTATINQFFVKFDHTSPVVFLNQFLKPRRYSLIINYHPLSLDNQIASISAQLNQPFIPSEIELTSQKTLNLKTGQLGLQVDSQLLKQQIISHLRSLKTQPVDIPLRTIGSLPSQRQINKTTQQAQKLINKSLILTGDFNPVTINDATLVSWLDFNSGFNQSKINQFCLSLAKSLNKDPVNAVFKFENNKVTQFRPARDGLQVKTDSLSQNLQDSLARLIATTSASLSLPVPAQTIPPLVRTQDANNLGIQTLLGRGTSTFRHSSSVRNHNIQKGASIVNHILVPPGQTFSFLKALGEVTLEAGYKKAYIIRQGRTELDVGGGICQVSTTFFRAMLNSGVDILERHPHAFRVSYYEEDMPPGYDATIFIPSPDLRFKNDTPAHILIQSKYDAVNKKLTYEFYGTSDGRRVDINNYRKWGYQPAPPTQYIDDPTLPPGKLVKEETAVPGLNTAFDWTVTKDNQILHQKTFYSYYTPWPAVYRRGI